MRGISAIFFLCLGIYLAFNHPDIATAIYQQAMLVVDAGKEMITEFQRK